MATNYPGSLDSYSTKAASDTIAEGHINDPQDAIEAIEAKVGTGASTATDNTVLRGTGAGTTAFGQVDSGDVSAVLGAWVNKSASYGAQQAATDGFVIATGWGSINDGVDHVYGYSDSASNPTTLRGIISTNSSTTNVIGSFCFPVKKGDYWKVVHVGSREPFAVWWIPLGA